LTGSVADAAPKAVSPLVPRSATAVQGSVRDHSHGPQGCPEPMELDAASITPEMRNAKKWDSE
jgi:hypothetical protein